MPVFFNSQETSMQTIKAIGLILSTGILLAACQTATKLNDPAPVAQQPAPQQTARASDPRTVATVNASSDPFDDPKGILAKRSVYFDYDSYTVKSDYNTMMAAHAKYVASQGRKIMIEGNTDERGGAEYNLALGQKRAESLRTSLAQLGVPEKQMEAVSFGKEKPKASGSDEAAWAENRRADIHYQAK
jgi:peptidoglycan-associated lipoprotein